MGGGGGNIWHGIGLYSSVLWQSSHSGLWAIYLCKMIEGCSYMMCSLTVKQYLVDNFGFSDVEAGIAYGLWGFFTTVYGVLLGVVIDKVGVRWSLLVGGVLLGISRLWLALTLSTHAMLFNLYFLLPVGSALGLPVKVIAVKRYIPAVIGPFAYGMLYLALNVGYFVAGFGVDLFREEFDQQYTTYTKNGTAIKHDAPVDGVDVWDQMTSYRWISLVASGMTFFFLLIAFIFVHDVEVVRFGNRRWVEYTAAEKKKKKDEWARYTAAEKKDKEAVWRKKKEAYGWTPLSLKDYDYATLSLEGYWDEKKKGQQEECKTRGKDIKSDPILHELLKDKKGRWAMGEYRSKPRTSVWKILQNHGSQNNFWVFTGLVCATFGVRMLFRHLDATFPQYMERELGDDIKLGMVFSMNPLAVILFTLVTSFVCAKCDLMWTVVIGMFITSFAVGWLMIEPAYWTGILFAVTMALGESVWMPRFIELSMASPPDGEEGIFTALVNAPTFFVKFFTGIISGALLDEFCPEEGERHSRIMWLIILLISLTSPLLVGVLNFFGVWTPLYSEMDSANSKDDENEGDDEEKQAFKKSS